MNNDPHKTLAARYAQAFGYHGDITFHDFAFERGTPAEAVIRVARFELPITDGSTLWLSATVGMTVPADAEVVRHHFVSLGSSPSLVLAELTASTFHFDQTTAPLALHHTFPLGPGSRFRDIGYSHALLIAPMFEPQHIDLPGGGVHLLQVVPITQAELDTKKTAGIDALLDEWSSSARDLSFVDHEIP